MAGGGGQPSQMQPRRPTEEDVRRPFRGTAGTLALKEGLAKARKNLGYDDNYFLDDFEVVYLESSSAAQHAQMLSGDAFKDFRSVVAASVRAENPLGAVIRLLFVCPVLPVLPVFGYSPGEGPLRKTGGGCFKRWKGVCRGRTCSAPVYASSSLVLTLCITSTRA